MKPEQIFPPTYLLIAILLMGALHFLFPIWVFTQSPWRLLGVIPLVLGVGLNLIANRAFHESRTAVRPFERSNKLVTDGVYSASRNPMYLGFVLILLGLAILLGSLAPIFVVLLFMAAIQFNFISAEERMLAERFGAEWQQYAARTRRWI
jgi:protein-S-isoprenylcysteine O-methyltransferase Ste14